MFRIDELIVYREYEQDQDQVLNDMAFIVEETETMGMPVSDLRGLYFSWYPQTDRTCRYLWI